MSYSRQYCKLCDIADFDDPAFLGMVEAILPERDPLKHIERKVWEFAMLGLFMEERGLLTEDCEVLSVGAGDERILFWLANRVGRIVATDIYGSGQFSGKEAEASMLENPAAHAPFAYREDHLEVLWMDGRDLRFADSSFDLVFTLSSIEHFGSLADVGRSAAEIGRVLRPGGHAVIVTECLVRLHPLDHALTQSAINVLTLGRKRRGASPRRRVRLAETFTRQELQSAIVEPSGLEMIQQLETTISPRCWENVTLLTPDGRVIAPHGNQYPMILIQNYRSVFTSVCLVLEKARA